jgi:hypothetical protein
MLATVLWETLTRVVPETAERFAYAWHGPPQGEPLPPGDLSETPAPLRKLYEVASLWPTLIVQNSLLWPPERDGDRLLFYVENQGLCSWLTRGSHQLDAPVWAVTGDHTVVEHEPLSRFVITVLVLEAVLGAPHGASAAWFHADRLRADFEPLQRLPFEPWRGFPAGATFYASSDLLAFSCINPTPEGDDFLSVWVGARDASALAALDPIMDENWDYDSRRDS